MQAKVNQTALIGREIEEANHRGELCLPQIARYASGEPLTAFSMCLVEETEFPQTPSIEGQIKFGGKNYK